MEAALDNNEVSDSRIREYEFTPKDFDRIKELIYKQAGISLSSSKQNMVYSRLAKRLRAKNIGSFKAYLDNLECGDSEEWEAFTNSLTTNLTAFFREQHHFPILQKHVEQRKNNNKMNSY